jgi:integrase
MQVDRHFAPVQSHGLKEHDMENKKKSPLPARRKRENANGQGTLYFDANRNRYVAQIHDIHGIRRSKFRKTKKELQIWLDEQKRLKHFGESSFSPNPKMTVAEYFTNWIEFPAVNRSSETLRGYRSAIKNHIIPNLGPYKVNHLNPTLIEKLLGDMRENDYAIGSLHIVYAVLSVAFNDGIQKRILTINPMQFIKKPSGQQKSVKHIPKHHFEDIYREAMLHSYLHARVEAGMMLGLRPGEVYGLKWKDFDWQQKTLMVERQLQRQTSKGLIFKPVKQKQERMIQLTDNQIVIFRNHLKQQIMNAGTNCDGESVVFPNSKGQPLDRKADAQAWSKLLKQACVPHYTLYQMRKTAFTNFASTGASIPTLLKYTGHTNVSTVTKHYAFATSEEMSSALKKMDAIRPNSLFDPSSWQHEEDELAG